MALGTNNPDKLDNQDPNYDYSAGRVPFPQSFAATNRGLGDSAHLATELKANSNASNGNFQFSQNPFYDQARGALGSMYQGQNALQKGPQNAFSQADQQAMHAMGNWQLQNANQQSMRGYAQANASRGVAGNSLGGLLGQSLGVQNAGALAQGDLAARMAGMQQGTQDYNARNSAASNLGGLINNQDQRNFMAQDEMFKGGQEEKQNAFTNYQSFQKQYGDLYQQYLIQANSKSGAKKDGATMKAIQAKMEDAKRNMSVWLEQYNRYGNVKNPYYSAQIPYTG